MLAGRCQPEIVFVDVSLFSYTVIFIYYKTRLKQLRFFTVISILEYIVV